MVTSPFTGQLYKLAYVAFDGNVNDQIESFDIDTTDGGKEVYTLMRGRAGRLQGAASATLNFSGTIPAVTTDVGGEGLDSQGMVTGKGVPLDQTMLTNYNANNYQELTFTMYVGPQTNYVQKLFFSGNIVSMKFSGAVGSETKFSGTAMGSFNVFQE
jgi:hypothetical protein